MRPRSIWLAARSAELRAALLDLGLTVTDAQAQTILADKISEHITLIGISRRTAQNAFTEERLLAFAQSLAVSLSDEAPGADLIAFERSISMPLAAVGLTTAALAEALKVAHINLDDIEAVTGLSLLSTLGMITADAHTSLVPTPRPLLLRIARYLDAGRGIHPARREPPRRTRRSQPLPLRRHPRPGRRRNPHPSPTATATTPRHCGALSTHAEHREVDGAATTPLTESATRRTPSMPLLRRAQRP